MIQKMFPHQVALQVSQNICDGIVCKLINCKLHSFIHVLSFCFMLHLMLYTKHKY